VLNAGRRIRPAPQGIAKKSGVTYGIEQSADISAKKFQLNFSGLAFTALLRRQTANHQLARRPHQRLHILALSAAAQALAFRMKRSSQA